MGRSPSGGRVLAALCSLLIVNACSGNERESAKPTTTTKLSTAKNCGSTTSVVDSRCTPAFVDAVKAEGRVVGLSDEQIDQFGQSLCAYFRSVPADDTESGGGLDRLATSTAQSLGTTPDNVNGLIDQLPVLCPEVEAALAIAATSTSPMTATLLATGGDEARVRFRVPGGAEMEEKVASGWEKVLYVTGDEPVYMTVSTTDGRPLTCSILVDGKSAVSETSDGSDPVVCELSAEEVRYA